MRIDSDTAEAGRAAGVLLDLAAAHGAQLARDAVLRIRGTAAWIAVPDHAAPAGLLIAMPPELLPDVTRARLALDGDRLRVDAAGPQDGPSQVDTLYGMVALYNALDRPRQWRARAPWHVLAGDPELLDHLAAGRDIGPEAALRRRPAGQGAQGADAEPLLRSFLATRTYPLAGGGLDGGWASLLMPFLDLLDHHWQARPFHRRPVGVGRSVICAHPDRPVPGSDACFVQYSALDRLTSLLLYGFIDTSSPIANGVPVTLRLADGAAVRVRGEPVGPGGELHRGVRDIALHVPPVAAAGPDRLEVGFLICAGAGAADALPRVLGDLVDRLRPDLGAAERAAEVGALRAQLLEANAAFHRRTLDLVAAAHAGSPAAASAGRPDLLDHVAAAARQDLALIEADAG
jgi:hypothetical protein